MESILTYKTLINNTEKIGIIDGLLIGSGAIGEAGGGCCTILCCCLLGDCKDSEGKT